MSAIVRRLLTACLWLTLLWPAWSQQGAGQAEAVQFYRQWKKHYLRHGPGAGEAYILVGSDSRGGGQDSGTFSISEGHGYGMLLTVAMARFDPLARADFERLYHFYLHHPSPESPRLMAWNQTHHDKNSVSSASDGDLDIAYALLWAGQTWGEPYGAQGRAMLSEILRCNVNPKTQMVGLGSFIHPDEPDHYFGVRTSDIMPGHFRAFARVSHDRRWETVLNNSYRLLANLQRQHSPKAGLWPDFVIVRPGQAPQLAPPDYLEGKNDASFGYNACRVPFRLGVDALCNRESRAIALLKTPTCWLDRVTHGDPSKIANGYTLKGARLSAHWVSSQAFAAPIALAALCIPAEANWAGDCWDFVLTDKLEDDDYYGNTLKALCLVVRAGLWRQL